jgi:hypothetical protein
MAKRLNALEFAQGAFVDDVAGVERGCGLEEQNPAFFVGNRTVFDPTRYDDEFTLLDPDLPVAKFHAEAALNHEKQFVFILVMMKDKFAFQLVQFHVLTVEFGSDVGFPVFVNLVKLLSEVDFVHDGFFDYRRPLPVAKLRVIGHRLG